MIKRMNEDGGGESGGDHDFVTAKKKTAERDFINNEGHQPL